MSAPFIPPESTESYEASAALLAQRNPQPAVAIIEDAPDLDAPPESDPAQQDVRCACGSKDLEITPYRFRDGIVGVVEHGETRRCLTCDTVTRREAQ